MTEFLQLLREWPPGFGGVERVAHELGSLGTGVVYSFDVQHQSRLQSDPLPVTYPRRRLTTVPLFGRFHLPLASWSLAKLIMSSDPLHGHLPSPGVLIILILARVFRPHRYISAHWHCFLEPRSSLLGFLWTIYQWFALKTLSCLTAVVTTSPSLSFELQRCGCSPDRLMVLPCCLSHDQEIEALALPSPSASINAPLRVLFIGRLDSYKRLDWLLDSMVRLEKPWKLSIVGDGPKRAYFEELALNLFDNLPLTEQHPVQFYGRLSEAEKLERLAESDLLVLPSDRSNEAFGIVQLEAMAAGRPALAFDLPRSGMGWVGQLPSLSWSQSPQGLPAVLQQLADQPQLRSQLCYEARQRYLALFARSVWLHRVKEWMIEVEPSKVCFAKD